MNEQRLQVYLKEYDMLVAENRLWLAGNDPKLLVAFSACIGLASAGIWKGLYVMFLLIPFVVVFLGFILLLQFNTIVLLNAQLAVLEEKINSLFGPEPTLTYFSRTAIAVFDRPFCRDPITGRKKASMNMICGYAMLVMMVCSSVAVLYYALPKLVVQNSTVTIAYASLLSAGVAFFCLMFIKIGHSKQFLINVIRNNFMENSEPSNGIEPTQ